VLAEACGASPLAAIRTHSPRACSSSSARPPDDMTCRTSIPVPAATGLHAAGVTATCAARGPVGRSWAYGGLEKPTTVSDPTNPSSGAARGSAAADVAVTMIATVTSTLVAENRPCRAAAAVPVSSIAA
jgi:hypothetical protein